MSLKVDLLIIDPQVDFCKPNGALYVEGADDDMKRVAGMIKRLGKKINDIHVTLDSHHFVDIAHPVFWKDENGKNPDPFTIINRDDVETARWVTILPSLQKRALDYVRQLEANGRYPLCIWPPHCLIGSSGHAVHPELFEELVAWERDKLMTIDYVTKGSNPYTEHYSAVKADVPDPSDVGTQMNIDLVRPLKEVDMIGVMGEAGSHCLANTARDIADEFGDDSYVKKIVLIENGTSPVTGFENLYEDFKKDMVARGMQISNTQDFLA